jgi:hypothetical protein
VLTKGPATPRAVSSPHQPISEDGATGLSPDLAVRQMIVGVYGVGYAIAALDPSRHWPVVLVGLLGKIFGPIGFLSAVVGGTLPLSFGLTILTDDLIWWLPFALILLRAYQSNKTPNGANA